MFVSKRQDCLRAASFTFYKNKNRNLSFSLLECFADRFWHRYCFSLLLSAAVFKLLKPRQAQLCHSEGDVMCCYVVFEIMGPVSKLTCLAEKQHLLKTTQSENCCGFNNKRQKNCSTDGAKMLPIMKQTALKGLQHLGSQLRVKQLQHLRTLSLQVQTVCADLWPPTMFLKSELLCKPSQRRQEAWGGSGGDDGVETLKTQKQLVQTSCAPKHTNMLKLF